MSEEELLSINNFDLLFENNYCDGIVINFIRNSRNAQDIKDYFRNIDNDRVVLKLPKTIFPKTIISLLKEYKSINYLIYNENNKDDLVNELELMKKEVVELLNGEGPKDLKEVCLHLAANMLYLTGNGGIDECMKLAEETLSSGKALAKFKEMNKPMSY